MMGGLCGFGYGKKKKRREIHGCECEGIAWPKGVIEKLKKGNKRNDGMSV